MNDRPEILPADERQQVTHYYRQWSARVAIFRQTLIEEGLPETAAAMICSAYIRGFMVPDYSMFYRQQAEMLEKAMKGGLAGGIVEAERQLAEDEPS